MADNRFDQAQFTKTVSEACFGAQMALFKAAWEPCENTNQKNGQHGQKGKGYDNPFLAPLTAGVGAIGDLMFQQMQRDMDRAMGKTIYPDQPHKPESRPHQQQPQDSDPTRRGNRQRPNRK